MIKKPHLDVQIGRETFAQIAKVAADKDDTIHNVATRYALERFLQRLFHAADGSDLLFDPVSSVGIDRESATLKGGMTMTFAEELPPLDGRSTGDADLHFASFGGSMEDYASILRKCLEGPPSTGPDDGVRFDVEDLKVSRDREERSGGSVTIPLQIGKLFLVIKSDVTFDARPMHAAAPVVSYPSVLPGRMADPVLVRRVPFEFMVADKLSAAISLGIRNYRIRDYYDMRLILGRDKVDREALAETVAATMTFKGLELPASTDDIPAFSNEFALAKAARWDQEKVAKRYLVDEDFPTVVSWLRAEFQPILDRAHEVASLPEWAHAPR